VARVAKWCKKVVSVSLALDFVAIPLLTSCDLGLGVIYSMLLVWIEFISGCRNFVIN